MKKPRKRSTSLSTRFATKERKRDRDDDALLQLACEPVPLDSGFQTLGRGAHMYVKMNNECGSVRIFRFRNAELCQRAYQLAVHAADDEKMAS